MDFLHRTPRETTSDNFAWKVRLKLNQERNAMHERSVSYGALVRKWNVRYAAASVLAAAVVLVVGLYSVHSGLWPVAAPDSRYSDRVVEQPAEKAAASPDVAVTDGGKVGIPESVPARSGSSNLSVPVSRPPDLEFRAPGRLMNQIPVSGGMPSETHTSPLLGLIDRPAPMTIAEFDSIMNAQLNGLTPEEQRQYLNQYIILLQRHMMRVMINRTNR
jgi:hypothetical protein